MLAIGGLQEMERQGIAVPGQIAVMGVDNTIYGEICKPQLSTCLLYTSTQDFVVRGARRREITEDEKRHDINVRGER